MFKYAKIKYKFQFKKLWSVGYFADSPPFLCFFTLVTTVQTTVHLVTSNNKQPELPVQEAIELTQVREWTVRDWHVTGLWQRSVGNPVLSGIVSEEITMRSYCLVF